MIYRHFMCERKISRLPSMMHSVFRFFSNPVALWLSCEWLFVVLVCTGFLAENHSTKPRQTLVDVEIGSKKWSLSQRKWTTVLWTRSKETMQSGMPQVSGLCYLMCPTRVNHHLAACTGKLEHYYRLVLRGGGISAFVSETLIYGVLWGCIQIEQSIFRFVLPHWSQSILHSPCCMSQSHACLVSHRLNCTQQMCSTHLVASSYWFWWWTVLLSFLYVLWCWFIGLCWCYWAACLHCKIAFTRNTCLVLI